MKRNIYGKKMFIDDLFIVSLWTLFVWHFAWGRIMAPALIGLRLVLCFMLYRRSRWSFFNAMLFTAMYIGLAFDMPCDGIVFRPIYKYFPVALHIVADYCTYCQLLEIQEYTTVISPSQENTLVCRYRGGIVSIYASSG